MQNSLTHMPVGKWSFDQKVTTVFEDMLERSIPQYEFMRQLVDRLICEYGKAEQFILDLGCSRGSAFARAVNELPQSYFLGIDASVRMVEAAKTRYAAHENVEIRHFDLRNGFPIQDNACVILSVLTLQFIPIEYRQSVIEQAYHGLNEGGALIVVEKVLGNTAQLDQLLVKLYYEMKEGNGYAQEAIRTKRKSLEGVLVPVTAKWNEDFLQQAGFRQVDCFWRCLNFAGWVAIK